MKSLRVALYPLGCLVAAILLAGCGGGASSFPTPAAQNSQVPIVSSISPAMVVVGSGTTTVTVNGSGFLSTTVIQIGQFTETTTYISSSQVTVAVPAAQLASAGMLTILARNGNLVSTAMTALSLAVQNPNPTINLFMPSSFPAGGSSATLSVAGTGFVSSSVISINGTARSTALVSPTQVTTTISAADQAAAANLLITVTNPAPGGGTSPVASLDVVNPPVGALQLTPTALTLGARSPATITLTGNTFLPASVVQVNGTARASTFIDTTTLTFIATVADQSQAGTLEVTVINPSPGGGTSSANLNVNNPPVGPVLLSPAALTLGASSPVTISVTGNTFVPASTIRVNGIARTTTFVNATTLTFVATVADQKTAGNLQVTVANPSPGGGTSPAANLIVTSAANAPVITSVSPITILAGAPDTTITVRGSGFSTTSIVQWNGTGLSTGYQIDPVSTDVLFATVPAAYLPTAGTATVTVSTPTATPSLSNAVTISVANPPVPTVTLITPSGGPIGTNTTIQVTGSGFTTASIAAFNGITAPTQYVSASALTVQVPASSLITPNVYAITVTTPAPGGGTSTPGYFTAYVPIENNSMVYNPMNGLFYVSVPSAAGAPYGNSVVSVDPVTGSLGKPIPVGSEPNRMAITADGRYVWVALDGASAVRKVDLAAGTAGLQFSIADSGSSQTEVAALAALPGASDSVVVSTYLGVSTEPAGVNLAVYDSGVPRSSLISFAGYDPFPWALIVDPAKNEIYGPGNVFTGGNYNTYQYDATGVTLKSSNYTNLFYAQSNMDDVPIAGGRMYLDDGQIVDPESGALLSTLYTSGTSAARGSITVDSTLGLAFVLEGYYDSANFQLGAFHVSDGSPVDAPTIPIYNPIYRASYQYQGPTGNRPTRWGADGIAFRSAGGFISLRTSLVQDLSATNADLGVALNATGASSTGSTTIYTATITNQGPAASSGVELTASLPTSTVLTSVTSSVGSCSGAQTVLCNLGSVANGASVTVTFMVLPTSAGVATMTVQVGAAENDPIPSNNQAAATVQVTGSVYNLAPAVTGIAPAAIVSGSGDTVITVSGTNFASTSTVLLSGTALPTSYNSSTELKATIPAADLTTLGWAPIIVATPAPGGGTSAPVPVSVFSVLNLGVNHIAYDPYSRRIMAAVSTGSSAVTGNAIAAIIPETASVGASVPIGGTPTGLALTSDGQFLYALVPGSGTVARFNMLTGLADFSVSGFQAEGDHLGLRDIATEPGVENTIALDQGEYFGNSIFDFDPLTKTATSRGASTGADTGTCLAFPNASSLFAVDLFVSPTSLDLYQVTSSGLRNGAPPYAVLSELQYQNCFKLSGNLLFTQGGGVATTAVSPAIQVGTFEGLPNISIYGTGIKDFDPDTSLGRTFYLTSLQPNVSSAIFDSVTAFDNQTFMPVMNLSLPFETFEGNAGFTGVDVVRWGQDGLAILSSGGHIYLLRGAAIVPGLLSANSPAVLSSSSFLSINHGAGNTDLTLAGNNFVPGVAVLWNGSYRTTTIVDTSHVMAAIPASDLASAGTASVAIVNPGAIASSPLTITIQ